MENNYFLRWAQRLLLLFLLITTSSTFAQSFLISFPDHSSSPTQNPRDLTACNGSSLLRVRMDVAAASTTGATVTIQLPPGVEYIPGTVTKVGGTAALTIADNGGTANAPQFLVGPSTLAIANMIEFTIDRRATCAARDALVAGTTIADVVTGVITGSTASSETTSPYQILYPVFSFVQPATQADAVLNTNYTRTFTINNGGNGGATAVYFSITYTGGTTIQNSLALTGGSGATGTPVTLTPTSSNGNTYYYTIPASALSGGVFTNGENLIFTEDYKITACGASATYNVGWGCDPAPASWCQTVTGSGDVAMASGVPNFSGLNAVRTGFVDSCTPFTETFTLYNSGTGAVTAASMFNAKFRFGGGAASTMSCKST